MTLKQNTVYLWTGIIVLFISMLVCWGYTFGHENSIQLIPLALHAHDSSLFPHDFYVQEAAARFPNERSFFLMLLYPFGTHLEWPAFILFTISTLVLFRALIGIAEHISGSRMIGFLTLLIVIFPFNFHALGMNELFGRELSATLLSDASAAMALWMYLRERRWPTFALLIFSTLMHPLAGLHMFLLICGAEAIQACVTKTIKQTITRYLLPVLVYALTAGTFIIFLQTGLQNVDWTDAEFFRSFFVFRNAHHYIPTAYPTNDWWMLGTLFLLAPILLFRKQRRLSYFSMLIIIGCIFYSIGVLDWRSVTIATAQWFKTTMWLEFIGFAALLTFMHARMQQWRMPKPAMILKIGVVLFCVGWWLRIFPTYAFWKTEMAYEFPFYMRVTPEIDISRQIAQHTPKDALLIQPAGLDEIKYYSMRSSYIDYKALTHTKGFIREWSKRFEEVYGIAPATSEVISFAAVGVADAHLREISPEQLDHLHRTKHITHLVTFADVQLPYPVVAQNTKYIVYQL